MEVVPKPNKVEPPIGMGGGKKRVVEEAKKVKQSLKRASLRTHSKAQFYPLPPPFQSFSLSMIFLLHFPSSAPGGAERIFWSGKTGKGFFNPSRKKSSKEDNCTIAAAITCLSAWASA